MTEKELIRKLNILKQVKLETSWKKETRDVLLAQVSNSAAKEVKIMIWEKVFYDLKNSVAFVPRAAWGAICFILVLASGGFGVYAANYSKPGDYFYTARILKEKTQIAMTFNKEEKVKLDIKLANTHAKEISEVLSDPNYRGNEKQAKKLAQNFQDEINTVKEGLSEIGKIQEKNSAGGTANVAANSIDNNDAKIGIGDLQKDSDGKVLSADYGKDDKGMQIYISSSSKATLGGKISTTTIVEKTLTAIASGSASTTITASASSTDSAVMSDKINTTLDKATESFNTKDFTGAKDMLEQVSVIIEKINSGEVKETNEAGTSTKPDNSLVIPAIGSSSEK
jgi:hypothetical protein